MLLIKIRNKTGRPSQVCQWRCFTLCPKHFTECRNFESQKRITNCIQHNVALRGVPKTNTNNWKRKCNKYSRRFKASIWNIKTISRNVIHIPFDPRNIFVPHLTLRDSDNLIKCMWSKPWFRSNDRCFKYKKQPTTKLMESTRTATPQHPEDN